AVSAWENVWLTGQLRCVIDRTRAQAVSRGLEALLSERVGNDEELRKKGARPARPHLPKAVTRARPNQALALLWRLHALGTALCRLGEPAALWGTLIARGHDPDPTGAICGGLRGPGYGPAWIPRDRFVDGPRLESYAAALVSRTGPPETLEAFLDREAALT